MAEQPTSTPGHGRPQAAALKQLLAYRPYLMTFIVSMTRDFDLAEELYQDVCVRACERWDERPQEGDFGAWVREIARRRTMARLKAKVRSVRELPSEHLIAEIERAIERLTASPDEKWEKRKAAVRACLAALPVQLRHVIEMRYVQNFSLAQIAETLGRERDGAAEVLARARAELDACIRGKLESPEGGAA